MSVSTWLARAAEARAGHVALRVALDSFAAEQGALADAYIDRRFWSVRTAPARTYERQPPWLPTLKT